MSWERYRVDVPEGQSGAWKVSRFAVTPKDEARDQLRAFVSQSGRAVPVGTYTRLTRGGALVMSDTPDEVRDHLEPILKARGRVLVVGLGLGMVAQAVLRKPEVQHLTVVEKSPDVIRLVAPWLRERFEGPVVDGAPLFPGRVEIVEADALTWRPPKGARWDVAWFDIWDDITSDNLGEMRTLHRRFGRFAAWKGSWARWWCERLAAAGI